MTLGALLSPQTIAIAGVGRTPGGVGRSVWDGLIESRFPGALWPINPNVSDIDGRPCYPDVGSLPGVPDLIVIAVPAATVPDVVDASASLGVPACIVLSAGFKETGAEGSALERRIASSAKAGGMRLLGPNCLGLIVPSRGLNASFAGAMPPSGSVAVITQSGALGTALLDWARSRGGLSAFASLGNRADISESDLLEAFSIDPATRVIAGYLESVVDGRAFLTAASDATQRVPVIMLKGGSSDAGARAVSSHTGSLAGSDAAYEAAFDEAGVIRAQDMEALLGMSEAFAHQPLPRADGVVLLTNAGGPAVLATDACERLGVSLAELAPQTIERLRGALPAAAAVYNPVDILGDAGPERYAVALRILASDPAVNAVIVLMTPQAQTRPLETADGIASWVADHPGTTTLTCLMGEEAVEEARQRLIERAVPAYRYPERAVEALSAMNRYRVGRSRPVARPEEIERDREAVAHILAEARGARRAFVQDESAARIARCYGLQTPRGAVARDCTEARRVASEIGYPVAVKIASPDILHKSDIGGIVLDIQDDEALCRAWDHVLERAQRRLPEAAVWGALVQQMAPAGREVIIGMERDPTFGPLIMFGLGGIFVEVMHDVVFRLAPLDRRQARSMIGSIGAFGLLRGARGTPPADIEAIIDAVMGVSALVTDFPEIVELDINPLIVGEHGQGAIAADVRIGIGIGG